MVKIYDKPVFMTVRQAEEKFHPNSVVMIKCEIKDYAPVSGYVAAAETRGGEDYEELVAVEETLKRDSKNGDVFFIMTSDPFAGQGLYYI